MNDDSVFSAVSVAECTRRDFLQRVGVAAAGVIATHISVAASPAAAVTPQVSDVAPIPADEPLFYADPGWS